MTTPKKPPATEVRAERRRSTAAYRQRILAEAWGVGTEKPIPEGGLQVSRRGE